MAYMKEEDYVKLANAAATDLIDNNVPLNDSVVKLAEQFKLNQDQILRLCEATNNSTFNHIFKTKTASDDRLVDFQIADAKVILGNQIKEASYTGEAAVIAAPDLYELPNQMDQVRRPYVDHFMEKVAASDEEAIRVRVTGKGGDLQIFAVGTGTWEMPAGTVIKGESRVDAAKRILLNKTGLRPQPTDLKYVGLQTFRGKAYQTFEVDTDKLTRVNYPSDSKGNKPRIEYRDKVADFVLRPLAKPRIDIDLRTLEKTAAYLASEKLAARITHQDTLVKLASSFKLLYKEQSFEAFEKQAAAVHGKTAEAALSQVRTLLRQPAVDYNWDKLQKTAGYVDTDTPTFKLLQTALDLETKIAAHTQGQALLETQIKDLTQQLRAV